MLLFWNTWNPPRGHETRPRAVACNRFKDDCKWTSQWRRGDVGRCVGSPGVGGGWGGWDWRRSVFCVWMVSQV